MSAFQNTKMLGILFILILWLALLKLRLESPSAYSADELCGRARRKIFQLAEGAGFEPAIPQSGKLVFKTSALSHSANPPSRGGERNSNSQSCKTRHLFFRILQDPAKSGGKTGPFNHSGIPPKNTFSP